MYAKIQLPSFFNTFILMFFPRVGSIYIFLSWLLCGNPKFWANFQKIMLSLPTWSSMIFSIWRCSCFGRKIVVEDSVLATVEMCVVSAWIPQDSSPSSNPQGYLSFLKIVIKVCLSMDADNLFICLIESGHASQVVKIGILSLNS